MIESRFVDVDDPPGSVENVSAVGRRVLRNRETLV
jgi:hypothetical protein